MTQVATTVGPADHGRRMTLEEFDTAVGQEGRLYELSRGVIVVTDVPNPQHGDTVDAIRQALSEYRAKRPGVIQRVHGGSDCKLLIQPTESERHPDVAVYKTPRPGADSTVWSVWVPEVVIEVVSPESRDRDYTEKAEDYLLFGVLEYWIVDTDRGVFTVHRRSRGRWETREIKSGERYQTHLLPAFELNVESILSA